MINKVNKEISFISNCQTLKQLKHSTIQTFSTLWNPFRVIWEDAVFVFSLKAKWNKLQLKKKKIRNLKVTKIKRTNLKFVDLCTFKIIGFTSEPHLFRFFPVFSIKYNEDIWVGTSPSDVTGMYFNFIWNLCKKRKKSQKKSNNRLRKYVNYVFGESHGFHFAWTPFQSKKWNFCLVQDLNFFFPWQQFSWSNYYQFIDGLSAAQLCKYFMYLLWFTTIVYKRLKTIFAINNIGKVINV